MDARPGSFISSDRLGHETRATELAQRHKHGWKDAIALAGTEASPEFFFWRSEDGLDCGQAVALRRCLLFSSLFCRERLASGCFRHKMKWEWLDLPAYGLQGQ